MLKDTKAKFTATTVTLHWLIAVVVISLLAVGIYMQENEVIFLYPIHKSIGILVSIVIIARVVWRIINRFPPVLHSGTKVLNIMAKIAHSLLLLATIIMPISGMLMSAYGGHDLAIFGFELLAENIDPNDPEEVIPLNKDVSAFANDVHSFFGYTLIVVLVLHIAAALKHHLIDKDGTLRRMLGKTVRQY